MTRGQLEIVHKAQRWVVPRRPETLAELNHVVMQYTNEYQSPSDFVLEYVGTDGVCKIFHDLSLQEAYIRYDNSKLIVGVRPSLEASREFMKATLSTVSA